jgi:hypothetical protein
MHKNFQSEKSPNIFSYHSLPKATAQGTALTVRNAKAQHALFMRSTYYCAYFGFAHSVCHIVFALTSARVIARLDEPIWKTLTDCD